MPYDMTYRETCGGVTPAKEARMEMYVNAYGVCKPFDRKCFTRAYANAYFFGAPRIVPGIRQSWGYVESGENNQCGSRDSFSFEYSSD